jgi:hypothetical protein
MLGAEALGQMAIPGRDHHLGGAGSSEIFAEGGHECFWFSDSPAFPSGQHVLGFGSGAKPEQAV